MVNPPPGATPRRRSGGEAVLLEVRERRGRLGRAVKGVFVGFQALMLLGSLGTCAAVGPFLGGPDPEVALGAGMFGAMALGTLWVLWPLGTAVLGLLVLATRGRRRLIPAPPEDAGPVSRPGPPPPPRGGA